jgi:hypothetical protein
MVKLPALGKLTVQDTDPLLADSPMQPGMLTPFSVNVTVPVSGPEPDVSFTLAV